MTLAVVISTILSPRSFALPMVLGFRRLSGAVTVLAGMAHSAALWIVFTGEGAPGPAFGVWLALSLRRRSRLGRGRRGPEAPDL